MHFTRVKFIKYVGSAILFGSLSCGIAPLLASCSTVYPTFTVTDDKPEWVKSTSASEVNAIWKGYYFNDVNKPWEVNEVNIPKDHVNDIRVNVDKSGKFKDDIHKTQSCKVVFDILTSAPEGGAQPFDVHVTWTIKGTSFKKVSTITVRPPEAGIINLTKEFVYTSQPNTDYDVDPADFPNNSIQCVDGIYNETGMSGDADEKRAKIQGHLINDFVWYQYLIYNSLQYIYIDDSTSTYSQLDNSKWKLSIDLQYDYVNQVFNYITLHAEAAATIYTLLGFHFNGNVLIDYNWGQPEGSSKNVPAVPGPKLMGAYTIDSKDERNTHYPQGYIPKQSSTYTPYDQDFLALVPQNPDSYQTFNITITNSVLPTMTSGQHVYFLAQPRLFGLEYTTGQQHLSLRTADGYKPMDSFRNWQLTLPSYALSGMSYDFNKMQFIKYKDKKTIQQCYVDISLNQTFSNYLAPGDKQEWANSFMHGKDYSDVNLNNDPNFVETQKKDQQNIDKCLNSTGTDDVAPWKNINIYVSKGDESPLKTNIPYYQVIQQSSSVASNPASISNGNDLAIYHGYYPWNINFDQTSGNFTQFAMGLNYMFLTDNMKDAQGNAYGDNVFCYDPTQLAAMNQSFINNPTSN